MLTRRFLVCVLYLFVLSALPLAAQDQEAFVLSAEDFGAMASPGGVQAWRINARFDVLQAEPQRLALSLGARESRAAELIEFERRASDNYTWRGRMLEGEGSVTLTVRGKAMAGVIEADNAVYEIVPGGDGVSNLVLLDSDRFPECATTREEDGVLSDPEIAEESAPVRSAVAGTQDSGARIDVMVLYTAAARQGAGGTANIQATIQAAIDAGNTAYANSQIVQRLRLVHMSEVTYAESGSFGAHLSWLSSNSAVAALRNTYRADVVDLMVNDTEYCGLASLMVNVSPSFASSAFSVTSRTCAVGNFSLVHELGHNMGAHHDPANGGTAAYPYSYGHFVNGSFRTVMAYNSECTQGCTRVSRFSNPNVNYLGAPTGVANTRDNHRVLNNTASVVANFRPETGALEESGFFTLTPCRILDTRSSSAFVAGDTNLIDVTNACGIPANATAVALNVTTIGATGSGEMLLYPYGVSKPLASTISFAATDARANNTILGLPADGSGILAADTSIDGGGSTHVIVDVFGYFRTFTPDEGL